MRLKFYLKSFFLSTGLLASFTAMIPVEPEFEGVGVGNIDRGRIIVDGNCAGCHSVPSGEVLSTFGAPPSLDELARRSLNRTVYRQAFESRTHAAMPKFYFNDASINDIKAYIESFR